MKQLYSAGGIIVNPKNQVYLIHKLERDEWALSKGKIEDNESPSIAAVREVREETGIQDIKLLSEDVVDTVEYKFTREGSAEPESKTVYMFLFKTEDPKQKGTIQMKEEGLEGSWLSFDEAIKITKIENVKETLRKAKLKIEE
jgi:8-oxo-dGTP pyrophosphatase MutT (NUDIX family)